MASYIQTITNLYRMHNAMEFANSVSTSNSTYYVFAGKPTPFSQGDTVIDTPVDNIQTTRHNYWQDMLFGVKLNSTNVNLAVNRYDWASGTVYTPYDDTNSSLYSSQFYVGVQNGSYYDVFKCLDNNNGAASTVTPVKSQAASLGNFYFTSDGYNWKYMFSISSTAFSTFATTNYIPVIANTSVVSAAIPGTINKIKISNGGSGYNNYLTGTLSYNQIYFTGTNSRNPIQYMLPSTANTTTNYYQGCYLYMNGGSSVGSYAEIASSVYNPTYGGVIITLVNSLQNLAQPNDTFVVGPKVVITGDGYQTSNAYAIAVVNSSSTAINNITILSQGQGYSSAVASVYSAPIVGISNSAVVAAVISPIQGHGANPIEELNAKYVSVSAKFANSISNTIYASGTYRTVGIVRDPQFANVYVDVSSISNFVRGENVTQPATGAFGKIVSFDTINGALYLTNVNGKFVTGNSTSNSIYGSTSGVNTYLTANAVISGRNKGSVGFTTFNQTYTYTGAFLSQGFSNGEIVYIGANSSSGNTAVCLFSNSTTAVVTNKMGLFPVGSSLIGAKSQANFSIYSETLPDIIQGSGDILYVENITPITRSNTQTENINLTLSF